MPLDGFARLVRTATVTLGSASGRTPRSVARIRLAGPAEFPLGEYLRPTITPGADGSPRDQWRYLVPDGEGLWMRSDGSGFGARKRLLFHEHRISLRMRALFADSGTAIMVPVVGGNDHAIDFKFADNIRDPSSMQLVNFSSLGVWHHDREWRIAVVPHGGAPSLATELALQLREDGMQLMTQTEKMAERGVPAKLQNFVGGTILWCHFDTLTAGIVRDLESAGLEPVIVMGRPANVAASAALGASGYSSGP